MWAGWADPSVRGSVAKPEMTAVQAAQIPDGLGCRAAHDPVEYYFQADHGHAEPVADTLSGTAVPGTCLAGGRPAVGMIWAAADSRPCPSECC